MKTNLKHLIRYGLAAALLVALAVILAACSSTPSTTPSTSAPSSPQAPAASAPAAPQAPAATATQPNTTETSPVPAPNSTQRQGVNGTLSNINGNVLTLTTPQGTVTVNVSSNTNIQKTVNGAISDLQLGQSLSAAESQDACGNLTATSIMIRPQNQRFPPLPAGASPNPSARPRPTNGASPRFPNGGRGTFGTLSSINGNTLNLTTPQGSVTVNITSDTTIQKIVTGTISDLQNGQSLTVMGSPDANGNINAITISIRPQGASPTGT